MTKDGVVKDTAKTKRGGSGLKSFARSLDPVRKRVLGRLSPAEAGLHLEWASIVGQALATKTQPRRLRFPRQVERRDGVLTVTCQPAFALELQHMLPLLIERLNAHFGYRAIAQVRIEQARILSKPAGGRSKRSTRPALPGPREPRPDELPSDIADEPLAQALARLRSLSTRANSDQGQ